MYLYSYSKLTSWKCPEYINKWKSLWDGCRTSHVSQERNTIKQLTFQCFRLKIIHWKCIYTRCSKLMPWVRHNDVSLWVSFRDFLKMSTRWFSNILRISATNFSVFHGIHWWNKIKKHCVKCARIRSYSDPYSPTFGLNTDQNNPKFRHFSRDVIQH